LGEKDKLSNDIFNGGFNVKDRFVFDYNTNKRYFKHSWNRYGDIHFDVSLGMDWKLDGRGIDSKWGDYIELPHHLTPQPNDDEKKRLYSWVDITSMLDGCKNWVKNRGLINKEVLNGLVGLFHSDKGGYLEGKKIDYDENVIQQHQLNYFEMGV